MNIPLAFLAAFGSFALLMGAFGFQYIGDMAPCKLCIWQRWPHGVAIVAGLALAVLGGRLWMLIGVAATALTGAFGVYHTGVERGWWEGPNSCTSGDVSTLSTTDLMEQILAAPLVRCDEVPWELFTLSMASWNALISFGFCALWLMALRRA